MSARDVIIGAFADNIDFDMPFGAMADDLLSALRAAGYAVVPREPTKSMVQADAQLDFSAQHDPTWPEYWAAMIAAAEAPDA